MAAPALLESVTTEPPEGAAPVSVTVPFEDVPPATLVGLRLSDESVGAAPGGFTVSVAWRCVKYQPLIVSAVEDVTDVVVTVKVALVWPPGTLTKDGTVATAVLLLLSSTARPPVGAGAVSVTFPVEALPPVTLAGVSVSEESVGPDGAGFTLMVFVRVSPPADAEMIDQCPWQQTPLVEIGKVAVDAPAGTVTPAGTVATVVSWLESETRRRPPAPGCSASQSPPTPRHR